MHTATFVPGMELGNISPNGGEGMTGLRGGFGLTGCCQVCPEEFYKELNFLDIGDAQKLSAMNRFHGQFGLPAIPLKHVDQHYCCCQQLQALLLGRKVL